MTFNDLDLEPQILKAIADAGYTEPTAIQMTAIPKILEGLDLSASAQTGTGKTAAFVLPALNRLLRSTPKKGSGPRLLILVPTRELAMQVAQETAKYSKYLPKMKTVCIYGGAPYPIQFRQLASPYDILVATPGRLIDHLESGKVSFGRLEMLVLDEADRMLDMGFIHPVETIAASTPKDRQTLLFSATMRGGVLKLAKSLLTNPFQINVSPERAKHENIEQRLYMVNNLTDKERILELLLQDLPVNQAIVFTSTKRQARALLDTLLDGGHKAAALHGDMNQQQRTRTIGNLRQGKVSILVATDVAARGIDVQTISHVFNFDLAQTPEDHVHRIGRTGRANSKGIALSFAAPKDRHLVRQIEQYTGQKMTLHTVAGMPAVTQRAPRPFQSFRGERSGPSRDRSGPPSRERAGPWKRERSGPPMREMSGAPSRERSGPPARERTGPPRERGFFRSRARSHSE